MVLRTIAGMSIQAEVVISPATSTSPVVVAVSQATRAVGSWTMMASSTPSEIWSQSLSGCPSVTDSLVKNAFGLFMKLLKFGLLLCFFSRARASSTCPSDRVLLVGTLSEGQVSRIIHRPKEKVHWFYVQVRVSLREIRR